MKLADIIVGEEYAFNRSFTPDSYGSTPSSRSTTRIRVDGIEKVEVGSSHGRLIDRATHEAKRETNRFGHRYIDFKLTRLMRVTVLDSLTGEPLEPQPKLDRQLAGFAQPRWCFSVWDDHADSQRVATARANAADILAELNRAKWSAVAAAATAAKMVTANWPTDYRTGKVREHDMTADGYECHVSTPAALRALADALEADSSPYRPIIKIVLTPEEVAHVAQAVLASQEKEGVTL